MVINKGDRSITHFLNVDLEVKSRTDLQPLVTAFGKKVFVLFAGRVRRTYHAHFELVKMTGTPDATIRAFCVLIEALPKPARRMWDASKFRDFNIGMQAGTRYQPAEFVLSTETLKAAQDLGGRIAFTIYGPEA